MTENQIDNMDALLARYVAGSLPKPIEVLVASHLELCAPSRAIARALEAAAGEEIETETPLALSDREAMLAAVFGSAPAQIRLGVRDRAPSGEMPLPLQDFIGHSIETIPWKTKLPGYREYDLGEVDGFHAQMLWIKPGRKMPAHTHEGVELTLVVDGAFRDNQGYFGRGDISIGDESLDHRPIVASDVPCVCFAITDGGLRMTGSLYQRIGDILGAS